MFQHSNNQNQYYRYNMYPFSPYYANQTNYFQPFQVSFMNQPMFYPPKQPFQTSAYPHSPYPPYAPYTPYPVMNKKNQMKQQPNQFSSIMSQFKTSDGNYDINKMMGTAGQMMNTMNQVTGIIKQVGGFFAK